MNNGIVSTLSRQISWSNNVLFLSGTSNIEEKEFYIRLCIKNNYSARELNRQIASGYFQRYMLSSDKALPSLEKDIDEDDIPNKKIFLCTSKNNAVVEFAVSRTTSPTLVSTYKTELINKEALEKKLIEYRK